MRRRRPDLLKVLMEPIETDRRGEVPEGSKPYFTIPVFNYHDGLVSAIYQRQYIESARRFPDVPPLTSQQIEALDLLDELANDPKLNLIMELEPRAAAGSRGGGRRYPAGTQPHYPARPNCVRRLHRTRAQATLTAPLGRPIRGASSP